LSRRDGTDQRLIQISKPIFGSRVLTARLAQEGDQFRGAISRRRNRHNSRDGLARFQKDRRFAARADPIRQGHG
jgi:hypothetical protein